MLTQDEWLAVCHRLKLSQAAQQIAEEIRASPPSRRVHSAAGNVSVRYPSRKMGATIQAESHRNELAGIYEKEHDPETLEYYDQPPRIKLVYQAKSGRRVGVWHTPDYFVIQVNALGWEEWKMEEELVRLAEEIPHRYQQDAEGRWRCAPGEAYANTFGFFYRVRSSAEIDWVFQRNWLFLEDYLWGDCPVVSEAATHAVVALVTAQPGVSLQAVLQNVQAIHAAATPDDIYALIATEQVYVDLCATPLAEPERVRIFSQEEAAHRHPMIIEVPSSRVFDSGGGLDIAPGVQVDWDGRSWTIVNTGTTQTSLLAENGTIIEVPHTALAELVKNQRMTSGLDSTPSEIRLQVQELLAQASPQDLAEANRRYAIIAPKLAGRAMPDTLTPDRTIRNWVAAWRAAEHRHQCGYIGLLPHWHKSGNRTCKLPATTVATIEDFILHDYETLKQKPRYEVYGAWSAPVRHRGLRRPVTKPSCNASTIIPVRSKPRRDRDAARLTNKHRFITS